ncbi:Ribokinase-like protein [Suillus variegatus]|nr:Ribokinase-like protein [Suillus variegatus]
MASQTYQLFCIGNPLLDVQVTNGEELLKKYDLKANDAILAEEKHMSIYDELVKDYKVTYVAGGASQNAARGAAYVLPPNSVVYTGCVGDDNLADQLRAANKREGLQEVYLVKPGERTGACAVVLTGHDRSLAPLVDAAKVFYVEGFFLTHGTSVVLELSQKASAASKVFAMNFSAPFIPQFFGTQLQSVLPYCDIIIGNETEAEAYAAANGLPDTKDLAAIAKAVATSPKSNKSRPRVVVFTHGADPKVFKVSAIDKELIVDTNGAGDAFAGGFLWRCVEVGHKMGAMNIQLVSRCILVSRHSLIMNIH